MTITPPETRIVEKAHFSCEGPSVPLGHPRVWLRIIPEIGHVDCGYCGAHYVLSDTAKADAFARGS
ncbi:MAG: zinc-finger domain-containing protein [Rubellimicrobium sp.]|nr:zinc-finger domain-containing protein [Rubellimicrobium sp.]